MQHNSPELDGENQAAGYIRNLSLAGIMLDLGVITMDIAYRRFALLAYYSDGLIIILLAIQITNTFVA